MKINGVRESTNNMSLYPLKEENTEVEDIRNCNNLKDDYKHQHKQKQRNKLENNIPTITELIAVSKQRTKL